MRRADFDAGGGLTQPARALRLGGLNRPPHRGKDNRGGVPLSNGRHPPIHSCAKMTPATKSRPTGSMIGRRHKMGNRQLRGAGQAVRRLARSPPNRRIGRMRPSRFSCPTKSSIRNRCTIRSGLCASANGRPFGAMLRSRDRASTGSSRRASARFDGHRCGQHNHFARCFTSQGFTRRDHGDYHR